MLKPKQDLEQKTIQRSFWTMILLLIAVIFVNIISYYINISIGEFQAASQNLTERIRSKTINANLLFIEIVSGASDKDLNEVWLLLESIQEDIKKIGNPSIENKVNDAVLAFKGSMIELNMCYTDPDKKALLESRQADYYKAYSSLNDATNEIDPFLKSITEGKINNMKFLYLFLSIVIIAFLTATAWMIKNFVSMISVMEEHNRNQNKLLSTVVNSISSILIFTDSNQLITLWNTTAEKYFGIPKSKAEGSNVFETLPLLVTYAPLYHKAAQLQEVESVSSVKVQIGELERILDIKMIPSADQNAGILISIDDTTDLELSKKQAENAQRLETVRNLMKNLLQDFSEIFSMIENTIQTLEQSIEASSPEETKEIKNTFTAIRNNSIKAQDKLKKLANISKEKEFSPRKTELNSLIANVLDICSDLFDKNIYINRHLYDTKAFTVADPELIETVLFNMLENAADAVTIMRGDNQPKGGIIEVSLEKIYPDRNYRQIHPKAVASSYWVINIADNGVGMDSNTSAKIFDPFFTTKEAFGAAGIGLSVADEIIRKHRGFIEHYSVPGQGTSFSIFIPETV